MTRCTYCGSELEPDALLCGVCGHAAGAVVEPPSIPNVPADPPAAPETPSLETPSLETPVPEVRAPEVRPPEESAIRVVRAPAEPLLPVPVLVATAPHPAVVGSPSDGPHTFVLQFSTGESVTVRGDGLIGRAPVREPAEVLDQLVPLADAGRSVSKTHLAFGQENGRFWVADRYSTNGTLLRAPDAPPRRCEPGRRYTLSRGTRVDIGDQFFVVS